jgi:hypothetical protein
VHPCFGCHLLSPLKGALALAVVKGLMLIVIYFSAKIAEGLTAAPAPTIFKGLTLMVSTQFTYIIWVPPAPTSDSCGSIFDVEGLTLIV